MRSRANDFLIEGQKRGVSNRTIAPSTFVPIDRRISSSLEAACWRNIEKVAKEDVAEEGA